MTNSIKLFLSAIFIFFTCSSASASHLAGHDFTYVYLGDSAGYNHYQVTLTIFEDAIEGDPGAIAGDDPGIFGVFNGSGATIVTGPVFSASTVSMPITTDGNCDSLTISTPIVILRKTFITDYYLPPSATGYTIVYQRCCRNAGIVNIENAGNQGESCVCSIPPSGVVTNNNSASFTNYPPFIIALGYPMAIDFSATDADGDSLSYALCGAISAPAPAAPGTAQPIPLPPPFDSAIYMYPYSSSAPLSCAIPLTVDAHTGIMSGTPNALGRYLIDVCCSEWRSGVLINSVQREMEFVVATCALPTADTSTTIDTSLIRIADNIQKIAPNPASTTLSVISSNVIKQLTVTDFSGNNVVVQWNYRAAGPGLEYKQEAVVDISALTSGMYFVKVNNGKAKKFMRVQQQ